MILVKSTGYWSVGINLRWMPDDRMWAGKIDFFDDGFADDDADTRKISTQGSLRTRYFVRNGKQQTALSVIIDTLIADAAKLGITFRDPDLFYETDGESERFPPPPGWRETLTAEAERIGWTTPYSSELLHDRTE